MLINIKYRIRNAFCIELLNEYKVIRLISVVYTILSVLLTYFNFSTYFRLHLATNLYFAKKPNKQTNKQTNNPTDRQTNKRFLHSLSHLYFLHYTPGHLIDSVGTLNCVWDVVLHATLTHTCAFCTYYARASFWCQHLAFLKHNASYRLLHSRVQVMISFNTSYISAEPFLFYTTYSSTTRLTFLHYLSHTVYGGVVRVLVYVEFISHSKHSSYHRMFTYNLQHIRHVRVNIMLHTHLTEDFIYVVICVCVFGCFFTLKQMKSQKRRRVNYVILCLKEKQKHTYTLSSWIW